MFDPLQIPNVFRARSVRPSARKVLPTGFDDLDAALTGGWPHPALIEREKSLPSRSNDSLLHIELDRHFERMRAGCG